VWDCIGIDARMNWAPETSLESATRDTKGQLCCRVESDIYPGSKWRDPSLCYGQRCSAIVMNSDCVSTLFSRKGSTVFKY
jgi:hypothetical protein